MNTVSVDTISKHCSSSSFTLKNRWLKHVERGLHVFKTSFILDALPFDTYNANFKQALLHRSIKNLITEEDQYWGGVAASKDQVYFYKNITQRPRTRKFY